ncbi:MAG: hypothetical protein M1826_001964 [Phylliscum demangeonii]|nr:MAG: hypothetical protein M1826_001964 [Phylliscum demangeonii]
MTFPAKARSAQLTRFYHRAMQLESAEPVISFWCYVFLAERLLASELTRNDADCRRFMSGMFDRIDHLKASLVPDPAIEDESVAFDTVLAFALTTFERADEAMRAKQSSLQTVDTFQAAAVFFEVLQAFGALSDEVAARVKYAKFHALRIAKAVKAGRDPNDYEVVEPRAVMAIAAPGHADHGRVPAAQGLVEETERAQDSEGEAEEGKGDGELDSERHMTDEHASLTPAAAPIDMDPTPQSRHHHHHHHPPPPSSHHAPSPSASPLPFSAPTPALAPAPAPSRPVSAFGASVVDDEDSAQVAVPVPAAVPAAAPAVVAAAVADEAAIADATKHARWAISALTFDDVPTAVGHLQAALDRLGAGR